MVYAPADDVLVCFRGVNEIRRIDVASGELLGLFVSLGVDG